VNENGAASELFGAALSSSASNRYEKSGIHSPTERNDMRKLILAMLPLALLANCKAPAEPVITDKFHQPDATNVPGANGAGNSKSAEFNRGDPMSPFNADGSVKNSFPAGTVDRLNAIMKRGQDTIAAYDKARPGIEQAKKSGKTSEAIEQIKAFHEQTKSIKADLAVEGQKLVDTKQYYDVVIFSGMATFATKIESELADDLAASQKSLAK
jgi:hypothetical protein